MAFPTPAKSDSCSRGKCTPRPNHPRLSVGRSRKLKASCDFCALSKVNESRRAGRARLMCAMSSVSSDNTDATPEVQAPKTSPGHTRTSPDSELAQRDVEGPLGPLMSAAAAFPTPSLLDTSKWEPYNLNMEFLDEPNPLLSLDISNQNVDNSAFTLDHGLGLGMTNFALGEFRQQEPLDKNYQAFSQASPKSSGSVFGDMMELDKMELQQLTPCSPTCSSLDQTNDWPSHESPAFNGNQCIWRVLKMFQILHRAGPSGDQPKCDSAQPKGQRSKSQRVDAILTANRMAMETVSLALSCSCARNPTIYSLIVMIVHQVLGSYYKLSAESLSVYMAQGHEDRASTSSATSSVSSAQPQHSSVGTAFDVPFAIGGYVLKQAERESIFKHVLRSEIEKMGDLVTRLYDFHPVDDPLQDPFKAFIASLMEIQRHGLQ